jgi:transcriptional regulator GlxA family with amidase domain
MDARITTAIRMMHDSRQRSLPIRELANQVNLSPWYFAHLFKNETSVTPKRNLRTLQLKEAEALLKNSFLSVKQITDMIGCNDRSHFSRDFKNAFGLNPTEFRNHHRNSFPQEQLLPHNSKNRHHMFVVDRRGES